MYGNCASNDINFKPYELRCTVQGEIKNGTCSMKHNNNKNKDGKHKQSKKPSI
jgi:hypothetical protein